MILLRHSLQLAGNLLLAGVRTGRWWMPVLVPLLAVAAVVITTAKVVVPTVVYVFF